LHQRCRDSGENKKMRDIRIKELEESRRKTTEEYEEMELLFGDRA